jgi:transposase-like protein
MAGNVCRRRSNIDPGGQFSVGGNNLNNIVEQDHRAVKRVTQPMLGFKSFWSARILIGGIETMHMIRKGQMHRPAGSTVSAANQFYSLAA